MYKLLIHQKMMDAIVLNHDCIIDNTRVEHSGDTTYVILHGHYIATIKPNKLILDNCGYPSQTTHKRFNAILNWFAPSITAHGRYGNTEFRVSRKAIAKNRLELQL